MEDKKIIEIITETVNMQTQGINNDFKQVNKNILETAKQLNVKLMEHIKMLSIENSEFRKEIDNLTLELEKIKCDLRNRRD